MIVEAEWNKRLGRGFNSRRLHHKRTGRVGTATRVGAAWLSWQLSRCPGVFLMGATWDRLGVIKARLRLG